VEHQGNSVQWSFVIGALVLTVVGIVITAAFAVGARRQLVTIGQLSASGASPDVVRTTLALQGTVTGVAGALVGFALALGLLLGAEELVERVVDERVDGYDVRPRDLVVVAVIGIGAATLAALLPARTAARIPTLAALAGRRPLAPVSRRLVTWGFAGVVCGLALLFIAVLGSQSGSSGQVWAYVAIAGGVAELFGACAIAPAVVSRLEPLSARLHGSLRLGARSLARHRARTGAVVSAVAAAGALAVIAGAIVLADEHRRGDDAEMPDDVVVATAWGDTAAASGRLEQGLPPSARADIVAAVPGATEVVVDRTTSDATELTRGYWEAYPVDPGLEATGVMASAERATVASDDVLDALRATDAIRDALDEHGVVALPTDANAPRDDARVILPDGREVNGAFIPHRYRLGWDGQILVSEKAVADLGLTTEPNMLLLDLPEALTETQLGDLEDVQWDLDAGFDTRSAETVYLSLDWHHPRSGPTRFQLELILTGVALLFSLFVVGVSLALAAAESKDERDILTIAGAPPASISRSAGARAWLMAVIGAVMAVPVGFLPVVVSSWASAQNDNAPLDRFPVFFPTRTVLLLVVVVPLAVCVVAWAASATAQRLRPVRVSTATFE
jgi:putative ABC transport system permease protein